MSVALAPLPHNGVAPPQAEDEQLYTDLLRLQDSVIAGQHPVLKLPQSAIAQLKAALILPGADANVSAYAANQQQIPQSAAQVVKGLPGLGGHHGAPPAATAPGRGLNPIFLEKSDSLVRAEGQLKRQRLERDLQIQVDQRKHFARAGDPSTEGPSRLDIDAVLEAAFLLVTPVSGLKRAESATSFDTNDYYSSQAPDDSASDASGSKGSDRGAGAFVADYDRAQPPSHAVAAESSVHKNAAFGSKPPQAAVPTTSGDVDPVGKDDDDDDEYMPPDAAAFDSFREEPSAMDLTLDTLPEDDDSDYEPGEITQESNVPTPSQQPYQAAQPSPCIQVVKNHLTHIAAPQPNRVSPLAVAKHPSIEQDLELVNGRPEIVQKPRPQQRAYHPVQSRASTASPVNGSTPKKGRRNNRTNKRKQREERNDRPVKKGRRDRRDPAYSPTQDPYIKDEPISPPPFSASVPDYVGQQYKSAPAPIDLVSPDYAPPQTQYEPPRSGLRYEYVQPPPDSPHVVRVASPAAYRPVQRDTQDLRRVASLHRAQRPLSPGEYSPVAPYHGASVTYKAPHEAPASPRYQQVQYVQADNLGAHQYERAPSRAASPAFMAPPPQPTRRLVQDQYGNRFWADAVPAAPAAPVRASVGPMDRYAEPAYERAPSRMASAYPPTSPHYEPVDAPMAPPPVMARKQEVLYVDASGRAMSEYSALPQGHTARYAAEPTSPVYEQQPARRYESIALPSAPEPTSPVYQQVPRYEHMPPPPAPARQGATSPIYQPVPRAYSVRPEEPPQAAGGFLRQASVAPVQYARQDMIPPPPAPARAMSVMPGAGTEYQPQYRYAPAPPPPQQPAAVKYVDQYGNEVYPQQIRQVYQ
ncbi:hypothetical protein Tdes44962_MAKER06304 [Teratosphaeria destructans]|uniref:Uncharacterized protein n=1 Tax=Teratosphaeria destructans TaxID=418781 RepID=A0A9W7SHR4_9PEZI|nr:hypothetical protein Tdes44962_MAKER06304 [Teratosphaeria destructans]